ncbi:alpha/beta hydrolase [Skermanella rosea]|uniref:alpha/beta hydrolase n=1 Tax=Skermanella rosea TaxID=1817965 RepID=UPI00193428EA|nr:alpha/beta hydrolase [Skermanella rosea]UEM06104.1 alpha/beta hydrolase [Skermanella rosea]
MYRHLTTQDEIDREYNPRLIASDVDRVVAGWAERSAATRDACPNRLRRSFGPTLAECLHVFPAGAPGAPIHVFVHGGYWRAFGADDFSFIADSGLERGVATVVVNYDLCPRVRIPEITRQVRGALAWVWHNAAEFGGDRGNIVVSGHSAGGHLVGRLLATNWVRDYGLPADLIKGALPISGLFDLEPLRWSWLQPTIQLTGDDILTESPIRRLPPVPIPVVAAVGGAESEEFRRQSRAYADALRAEESTADVLEVAGRDHFTILDDLADADGPLWREAERMLKRTS